MFRRVLVTGIHIDINNEPRARHRIGVIRMARPSRLIWIIADDCSLLMTIEGFHGCIDIEYPRFAQQWHHAIIEVTAKPRCAFLFINRFEGSAYASSLTILLMSRSSGRTPSPRNAVI